MDPTFEAKDGDGRGLDCYCQMHEPCIVADTYICWWSVISLGPLIPPVLQLVALIDPIVPIFKSLLGLLINLDAL